MNNVNESNELINIKNSIGELFALFTNENKRVDARHAITINNTVNHVALFDSGCNTNNSLISKIMVESINIKYEACDSNLNTAKAGSNLKIIGAARIPVTFKDVNAIISFNIVDNLSEDIIFSLDDILKYFFKQYFEMLKERMESISFLSDENLLDPWNINDYEEAEELNNLYEPTFFVDYMNIDYDTALADYHKLLEVNIEKEFKTNSRILELMKSQLAINAFVKKEWTGIDKYEYELEMSEDMPQSIKPLTRRINPKLYETARKEFERLSGYFYDNSDSPIASPLVIAEKATSPFIRFCGDYKTINKYLIKGHYPIPHIQDEIARIIGFKIFLDIDLRNAFHQVRLSKRSRRLLSLVTPWGQKEPIYMPEGIIGGTQKMQEILRAIFIDQQTEPFTIQIHDNILILANNYEEAYSRLEKFLERAVEYGVSLKMEKTRMGFPSVHFFGYQCESNKHFLTDDRKAALHKIPFPHHDTPSKNKKALQSLLGCGVYFRNFVPHYSAYAQPLYDATKDSFNWKDEALVNQLREHHQKYINHISTAQPLYYPDYELNWILQTDASVSGLGGVLLQEKDGIMQPISFISKSHSNAARNWSTIQQEGHAIYYCVKKLCHLLHGKQFIIETDHNNLKYMEQSLNPAIIRMCLYLRAFDFKIKHIEGTKNKVADFLSRIHEDVQDSNNQVLLLSEAQSELISKAHGLKEGHFGTKITWQNLNKFYPGHSISINNINEYISTCATCLKNRQKSAKDQITPIYRPLPKLHTYHIIGIDYLTITPTTIKGNNGLYVIRNLTTKLSDIYPATIHDAKQAASSIYQYITTYGIFECIISDPGSDFTSKLVADLNNYIGMKHYISIVDRHESNGVERTNKEILRHLTDYVYDTRIIDKWDDPIVISTIRYFLNHLISAETGISPYEATFGSTAYMQQNMLSIPKNFPKNSALLSILNDAILAANTVLSEHIERTEQRRAKENVLQKYQPGDYIMYKIQEKKLKLKSTYLGPYKVISQENNNITCKHPCKTQTQVLHAENVYIFYGTEEQAIDTALRDDDQYFVDAIINYRGDPLKRSQMEFLIRYQDDSTHWLPYSLDISTTEAFENYCVQYNELQILLQPASLQSTYLRTVNAKHFSPAIQHTKAYLNMRSYKVWYDQNIKESITHLVPCKILSIVKKEIWLEVPLFNDGKFSFTYSDYFFYVYLDLPSFPFILVDEKTCIDRNW